MVAAYCSIKVVLSGLGSVEEEGKGDGEVGWVPWCIVW